MEDKELRLECLKIAQKESVGCTSTEDIILDANMMFQFITGEKDIKRRGTSKEVARKKNMKEAK